jgi:mannosyl-glycoprotein endo-beta-N-acetylglucosaminidase/stage II sporulation protein P
MSTFIGTRKAFVEKYEPFINSTVKGSGLFAGTMIAQAIIESSGKFNGVWSVGGSGLSRKANNFFGIKCGSAWKGKTYNANTGEYSPGGTYYIQQNACFRKYDNVEESIKDHLSFLQKNPRYTKNGVFAATNIKEQAEALKRAGYATAPNYAATIVSVYNSIKPFLKYEEEKKKSSGSDLIKKAFIPLLFFGAYLYTTQKK